MIEDLKKRLGALSDWALAKANDIIQQTHPDGRVVYLLPAPVKVRLTVEGGEALVEAWRMGEAMHWSVGRPNHPQGYEVSACGCINQPDGTRGIMPDGTLRTPKRALSPMTRDRNKVTCGACKRTRRWKERP